MIPEDFRQLGERIEARRQKLGLTLVQLANKPGYDGRSIRNVIKGKPTRPKTLTNICQAIEIDIEDDDEHVFVADKHGKYTLELYEEYEGWYFSYRRSFSIPNALVRSAYEIKWDDNLDCLTFYETKKFQSSKSKRLADFSRSGEIYISKCYQPVPPPNPP